MTNHTHSDGVTYFCNKDGCTQIKSAATARHTEDDYEHLLKLVQNYENQKTGSHSTAEYNILKRRVGELEGILASTQFANSQLRKQVDAQQNNKFKDYRNLAECIDKNVGDGSSEIAARRRCLAISHGDVSKEGATKSAASEAPAYAYNMGLEKIDYGKIAYEKEQQVKKLKSASTKPAWAENYLDLMNRLGVTA